ncbi:MAG: hypothetical protein JW937_05440 [Candidatus Omnitrophica bacterium]|nr:hypothetical protein [Candidatus Omnitrophota bacterium]
MKVSQRLILLLLAVAATAGCWSMSARREEMPRVDQEVRGNQGYIAGQAPAAERNGDTTRTLLRFDFEKL